MYYANKTKHFRIIGILNIFHKRRYRTFLFLTSNLTDNILECKMDNFFEVENRDRFFKNVLKKEIINNNYSIKEQSRYGFILGKTIKVTIDSNEDIVSIDIEDIKEFKFDIDTYIKELHTNIKYLIDIISLVRKIEYLFIILFFVMQQKYLIE